MDEGSRPPPSNHTHPSTSHQGCHTQKGLFSFSLS